MIVYAKHLLLMSLPLFAVPVVGLLYARAAGRRHRLRRPGAGPGFLALRLLLALLVPLAAQAMFVALGRRYVALALAGALYGATFGHAEDFPRLPAAIWGALGGAGAAYLYLAFGPSTEASVLAAALFAVAPFLAYRPLSAAARRRIGSAGLISPSRRILR